MSHRTEHKEEEEEEEKDDLSGSEDDNDLDEDMEALRRACMLTGRNPNDLDNPSTSSANGYYSAVSADSDSDDDLELVRNIKNRFSTSSALCEPCPWSLCLLSRPPPRTRTTISKCSSQFSDVFRHTLPVSAIPVCLCVHFVVENFE
jgi:myb proto-oncogene protein